MLSLIRLDIGCNRAASDVRDTRLVGRQSASGIAMVTLIDITVSATIRHNDSEPTASEAATAWINRDEATGAERPSKPATTPGNRIISRISLKTRANHPRPAKFAGFAGKIWADSLRKVAKPGRSVSQCPLPGG